ncbi:hypothetical protein [Candidatus Ichthyocystis sparus]|uniref:hypothetical protein n=1 Tax=Candidatus Ichthyocystis sparus TaxID=1561004 RepID=UPI0011473022|nr:hypothetical protein [Candidatus Ichthyocystis sparus]
MNPIKNNYLLTYYSLITFASNIATVSSLFHTSPLLMISALLPFPVTISGIVIMLYSLDFLAISVLRVPFSSLSPDYQLT